ncbi:MAG: maltose ABC transporter permease MalF, partial [Hyphomicrobiales bacterium]
MTTITEAGPSALPHRAIRLGNVIRYAIVGALALALMYIVWGLYLAGEPLFAMVVMALLIGIVVIFGANRFYTARFVFPAIAAVLIFIALPVLYTSYVGFTNFGARNLLTFDRVVAYHLGQRAIDKSTERPFALVPADGGYQLFLPEGDAGLISPP